MKLWRNTKEGRFFIEAFLDDYCYLIKAFLDIHQSTLDDKWLLAADALTRETLQNFSSGDGIFFNLASGNGSRLVQEVIELSDNVIPSSNSQMARNLFMLGHLLDREEYLNRSGKMLGCIIPGIKQNPSFHANWNLLLQDFLSGPTMVTILGENRLSLLLEISKNYLPGIIFTDRLYGISKDMSSIKEYPAKTLIYICHQKTCFNPVESVQEALNLLNSEISRQ
jgi:uncharacterized protein YyaL (SSP411 family)